MNKPVKTVLAVIASLAAWGVVNFASLLLLSLAWPALGEVGSVAMESGDYSHFTLPMLLIFLAMWLWTNAVAGWVAAFIDTGQAAFWVVLALLTAFALYNHLFVYWDNLPNWYNIAVIVIFPPAIWLGSVLPRKKKTTTNGTTGP